MNKIQNKFWMRLPCGKHFLLHRILCILHRPISDGRHPIFICIQKLVELQFFHIFSYSFPHYIYTCIYIPIINTSTFWTFPISYTQIFNFLVLIWTMTTYLTTWIICFYLIKSFIFPFTFIVYLSMMWNKIYKKLIQYNWVNFFVFF